jgi:hypothetical protein
MCWNATVSLQSFVLGLIAILLGAANHLDRTFLFFCLTITLMQGIEAIAWSTLHLPPWNTLVSQAAALLLWIQPIASLLTLAGTPFASYRAPLLLSYVLLSLLSHLLQPPSTYRMTPKNGHLNWEWIQPATSPLPLLVYFLYLLLPLFLVPNPLLLAIVLTTLGLSGYAYGRDNTWGSLWCWQVNIMAIAMMGWRVVRG